MTGARAAKRVAQFQQIAQEAPDMHREVAGLGEYWSVHFLADEPRPPEDPAIRFDLRWMIDGDVHFVEMLAPALARTSPRIRVRRAGRGEWNLVFEVAVAESQISSQTVVAGLGRLRELLHSLPPLPIGGPRVVLWAARPGDEE